MCDPEKCPLSEICEQRVDISEHFRDEQRAAIETRHEGAIARLDAADEETTFDEAILYAREASAYLKDSASNLVLDCDVLGERLDQMRDTLYCKGPIKQRKFGLFGPVVARMCGSDSRIERLDGHTVRLDSLDEYTLMADKEKL